MAHTTLLGWANSVRLTMVNDPGRKFFQEQVQTHGFSFLDDYLDNILSGPKQETLIELVKTPGRKKIVSRKHEFTSKRERDRDGTGESFSPTKSTTQALLDANILPTEPSGNPNSQLYPETIYEPLHLQNQDISIHVGRTANAAPPQLSIIAEDDEGLELTRSSIQVVKTSRSSLLTKPEDHIPTASTDDGAKRPEPFSAHTKLQKIGAHVLEPLEEDPRFTSDSPQAPKHTKYSANDITVPIRDPEAEPTSPLPTARKSVLSALPTLPEPIPLRKSMRVAKEVSITGVMLGTATPGNAGEKRTSWLIKAREAKALERVPKKSIANPFTTSLSGAGTKRKSDEIEDFTQPSMEERQPKAAKQKKGEAAPTKVSPSSAPKPQTDAVEESAGRFEEDGVLDFLRKKVQGLEARNDKQGSKASGDTVAALAQARALAEARIAERNHKEESPVGRTGAKSGDDAMRNQQLLGTAPPEENERRLSVGDLFPSEGRIKGKSRVPTKPLVFVSPETRPSNCATSNEKSTSTTPPHSPPVHTPTFTTVVKPIPVFNKPPPVFVPPSLSPRPLPTPPVLKEQSFVLPPLSAFSKPTSLITGLLPRPTSSTTSKKAGGVPLSAEPAMETVEPDDLFGDRGDTQAWVPSIQGTVYSNSLRFQEAGLGQPHALDDDDSWPIDEKLHHVAQWPFSGQSKEDSMTWSTSPSQSQRDGSSNDIRDHKVFEKQGNPLGAEPGCPDEDMGIEREDYSIRTDTIAKDPELEDILGGIKSNSIPAEFEDDLGQTSLVSSVSSQSQIGFFGQASKLFSSALGTSKKGKPEMKKVMQMAAVAAKKQQREDDKKVARLKEMENRRQLAMQRKAEEEKSRQQEQERKTREDMERRKREREEQAEKKPAKGIVASGSYKKEEELSKKRKLEQDKQEKTDPKKPLLNKTGSKLASSKQIGALSSSTAYNMSQSVAPSTIKASEKPSKTFSAIPTKSISKATQKVTNQAEDDYIQPSQILQTQMAARAKAAMQTETRVPSETIELPEVNSEYSDSDDEDRPRNFNPPDWAQSPELRQALEAQSTINPDNIFGSIRPLRMEEMFKARTSRFRARTSSANWSGADRLTVEEEQEYARRMGFMS